ncbi:MAG: ComEC family competence protein [Brockia lithotrophica]|nr:ComEC family competence protein [Brockia lithotrophica]
MSLPSSQPPFASVSSWLCSPLCAPLPYALALVGGVGAVYLSGLAQAVWIVVTGAWSVALYAAEHPRIAATTRARTALLAAALCAWGSAFALGVGAAEIREATYAREEAAFARLLSERPPHAPASSLLSPTARVPRSARELCGEAVVVGDPQNTPAGILVDLRVIAAGNCPPDIRDPAAQSGRDAQGEPSASERLAVPFTLRARLRTPSEDARLELEALARGAVLRFRGDASPPAGPQNPGERDYRPWAHARGTVGELRADDVSLVTLPPFGERFRAEVRKTLDGVLDEGERRAASSSLGHEGAADARALLRAFLLGRTDDLSPEVRRDFAEAGAVHLLVVSGLHVGILAWGVYRLAGSVGIREGARRLSVLLFVGTYASLAADSPAVRRAAFATAAAAGAGLVRKRVDPLALLSFLCALELLSNPSQILRPGFGMTYLLTFAILRYAPTYAEHLRVHLPRPIAPFAFELATTLLVEPLVLPFLAATQGSWPSTSPLMNLVLLPLYAALLPFLAASWGGAVVASAFGAPGKVAGAYLLEPALGLVRLVQDAVAFLARMPGAQVPFAGVPPSLWILWTAALLGAYEVGVRHIHGRRFFPEPAPRPGEERAAIRRRRLRRAGIALGTLFLLLPPLVGLLDGLRLHPSPSVAAQRELPDAAEGPTLVALALTSASAVAAAYSDGAPEELFVFRPRGNLGARSVGENIPRPAAEERAQRAAFLGDVYDRIVPALRALGARSVRATWLGLEKEEADALRRALAHNFILADFTQHPSPEVGGAGIWRCGPFAIEENGFLYEREKGVPLVDLRPPAAVPRWESARPPLGRTPVFPEASEGADPSEPVLHPPDPGDPTPYPVRVWGAVRIRPAGDRVLLECLRPD